MCLNGALPRIGLAALTIQKKSHQHAGAALGGSTGNIREPVCCLHVSSLCERHATFSSHHDVINDSHIDQAQCLLQTPGDTPISQVYAEVLKKSVSGPSILQ